VPGQQQGWKPPALGRYQVPPAAGVHHQVQRRSVAGGQQGAGSGLKVSRCPGGLILWPEASRDSRRAVQVPGQRQGRQHRPGARNLQRWQVITRYSSVQPLAGSTGRERASGEPVPRCPGGLILWPEASRDSRRAVPGTRATARPPAPARYQIPPMLADHHQVQQRSAAGGQPGAGNGPQVSRWPRCLIPWPGPAGPPQSGSRYQGSGRAASTCPGWGRCPQRSAGGEVWQLVAAGSPGAGFGLAVWLAVGFRAGSRRGAAVSRFPGGVIRQRHR
jgi:hypothetical protein